MGSNSEIGRTEIGRKRYRAQAPLRIPGTGKGRCYHQWLPMTSRQAGFFNQIKDLAVG
jgi:hypothetical protein